MSGLGSVFLGDRAHHLPKFHTFQQATSSPPTSPSTKPIKIDPVLALQLRIRWLESLVYGTQQNLDPSRKESDKHLVQLQGRTLVEGVLHLRKGLEDEVSKRDEFRKFYKSYDRYSSFLNSNFALTPMPSATNPSYDDMDQAELETLLAELEPDLRAADRDMLEVEALENRGVTSAGKLQEHEGHKGKLKDLIEASTADMELFKILEERIASLMERYANYTDNLSKLFVVWDNVVTEAEIVVTGLEREKETKRQNTFESETN